MAERSRKSPLDAAGDAWMSKERLRNAKARTNADAHKRKEVKPWEEPLGRSRGKIPWEEAAGKKNLGRSRGKNP